MQEIEEASHLRGLGLLGQLGDLLLLVIGKVAGRRPGHPGHQQATHLLAERFAEAARVDAPSVLFGQLPDHGRGVASAEGGGESEHPAAFDRTEGVGDLGGARVGAAGADHLIERGEERRR